MPTVGAEFVWRMENVLDVYARAYHPKRPQICFDEKSVQLIAETRQPLPSKPGQPQRFDYEYQRNGTANLFVFFQPLLGWRHVRVTDCRTKIDFAEASSREGWSRAMASFYQIRDADQLQRQWQSWVTGSRDSATHLSSNTRSAAYGQ